MIGTMQPQKLAEFYEMVLGKEADWKDGSWYGWQVGACNLTIGEHSEMGGSAKDPGRIMFNLETAEVVQEFERIKAKGAKVIKEPYEMGGMWIATLADPDGNFFQLMSPWEGEDNAAK